MGLRSSAESAQVLDGGDAVGYEHLLSYLSLRLKRERGREEERKRESGELHKRHVDKPQEACQVA
jgi:hypothetical protein